MQGRLGLPPSFQRDDIYLFTLPICFHRKNYFQFRSHFYVEITGNTHPNMDLGRKHPTPCSKKFGEPAANMISSLAGEGVHNTWMDGSLPPIFRKVPF